MPHLHVDVTRLIDRRSFTGIPRVMYELSTRFSEIPGCTLVAWNGKSYVEVSREAFAAWQRSRHVPEIVHRRRITQRLSGVPRRALSKATGIEPHFEMADVLLVGWGLWYDLAYVSELENLQRAGIALVEIAYDILPLVAPQFFSEVPELLERYVRRVYPSCALVLAISRNTRDDVERWLVNHGLTVPRLEVIRLGEDFHATEPKPPSNARFRESGLRGKDFILCVGTVEPRKNHVLLVYAYKLALRRAVSLPKLVVAGRKGWMSDAIHSMMTSDPEIKEQFVLQENTSDEELAWLYEHCLFSIYPSLCEGWGLPIAESLARGAPCIASNSSSIPEIAGDLIKYFCPVSTDECLAAIESLLEAPGLDAAVATIQGFKVTTWDETFETVHRHIRTLLKSDGPPAG